MDAGKSKLHGSCAEGEAAHVQCARILYSRRILFLHLVVAFESSALLVFEARSDWRCGADLQDEVLFMHWHFPLCHYADFRGGHVDERTPAPMVLNHVWCLLFRWQHLGHA